MANDRSGLEGQHEEVAQLLPWYANDTLEGGQRLAVEAHLADCAECRAELAWLRNLAPQVATSGPLPVPHPAQFDRLLERMVDLPADVSRGAKAASAWRRSGPWRWVVVGQAASVLLLVLWQLPGRTVPKTELSMRTLATPAPAPDGIRLRVVFDEQAREGELRALLVPLGATIVGGPSPLGVYTLVLPPDSSPTAAAAALRNRPLVEFAEPAEP